MADSVTLTPKQKALIAALLVERDIRAASKAVRISERTAHRWLGDSDFQRELKAAEVAAIDTAVRRLAEATGLAVDVLRQAMESTTAPLPQKIRAADVVLGRLLELRNLHTLEERLAAIEAALQIGVTTKDDQPLPQRMAQDEPQNQN